jgi:hypothetical protein
LIGRISVSGFLILSSDDIYTQVHSALADVIEDDMNEMSRANQDLEFVV